MTTHKNEMTFNSVQEFAKHVNETPRAEGCEGTSSDEGHSPSKKWDFNLGYRGALKFGLGEEHWEEGANKIADTIVNASEFRGAVSAQTMESSVVGFAPNVPAYINGEPECMFTMEEQEVERPHVRIAYTGFSCGCSADAIMNRGVALLSLVDALESQGTRCEVWFDDNIPERIMDCDDPYEKTDTCIRTRVCVKAADQHWDAATFAFAFAHPAFFRRLLFKRLETVADANHHTRGGYGRPCKIARDYDIHFDYMENDSGYYSLESALKKMQRIAKDAGLDVELIQEAA